MHLDVTTHGINLRLLAKAIYWPQRKTLFVADTHLGKDATFRHQGIPVPAGSSAATLRLMSELLDVTEARRLVILGDMFHSKSSLSRDVCDAVSAFCDRHAGVKRLLVLGNHDARVGKLPERWSIDVVPPGTQMGRIALGHHPAAVPDGAELLLCGHLHPALSLGTRHDDLGRLPCFWLSKGCLVLPAIGQFTGTYTIQLGRADRAWVVADDQVIEHSR